METIINTDAQATKLAARYGLDLSELRIGEEGFLMPHHGSKLRRVMTEDGPRFALGGYAADKSDISGVLALVA